MSDPEDGGSADRGSDADGGTDEVVIPDRATEDGTTSQASDPTVIRSLAVHVEDVIAAFEARREGRAAVLRATPPYHPRMRARLHVDHEDPEGGRSPGLRIAPDRLLDADTPAYPTPDETAAQLRASDESYTPERHRECHVEALAAWRETARDHVVEHLTVETATGAHVVTVKRLG